MQLRSHHSQNAWQEMAHSLCRCGRRRLLRGPGKVGLLRNIFNLLVHCERRSCVSAAFSSLLYWEKGTFRKDSDNFLVCHTQTGSKTMTFISFQKKRSHTHPISSSFLTVYQPIVKSISWPSSFVTYNCFRIRNFISIKEYYFINSNIYFIFCCKKELLVHSRRPELK